MVQILFKACLNIQYLDKYIILYSLNKIRKSKVHDIHKGGKYGAWGPILYQLTICQPLQMLGLN